MCWSSQKHYMHHINPYSSAKRQSLLFKILKNVYLRSQETENVNNLLKSDS